MSGYTPVFASMYDGSLYGRWPAAPVFSTMLSLCDKHGHVDMSYEAIAGRTGWPIELLSAGIAQLMQPDENSRTPDEGGRRLVPLETGRMWGWRVVNHRRYKEIARSLAREVNRERADRPRKPPRAPARPRKPPPAPPQTQTQTQVRESPNGDSSRSLVREQAQDVFRYWQEHLEHEKAILDGPRLGKIRARLIEGFTVDQLKEAVRGCKLTPHNMGATDGRRWDDVALICRDASHVERFIVAASSRKSDAEQKAAADASYQRALERSKKQASGL